MRPLGAVTVVWLVAVLSTRAADPKPDAEATFAAAKASGFDAVLNGRFKGGHITRHYGNPKKGVNAIQLEMAQAIYMDEGPPFTYRPERAAKVTAAIRAMLAAALEAM